MAVSESMKKAQKEYDKKCKHIRIRLRFDKDADVIEYLKNQQSVTAKIKELIRADIES